MKTILAVETSCDETAVAIVNSEKQVLAQEILSQTEHKKRGGVIPEIASRAHMEHLSSLIKNSIEKSNLNFCNLDATAATSGPGLIGGLIVGTMMAKAIAHVTQKPFIAVNHLEAHVLVIRLLYEVKFPFLVLLISGGHCQFLIAQNVGKYIKLGETLDDSLGEAFDKVARMLGLSYPGGPLIEKLAKKGNGTRFKLPRAMRKRPGCNFSFSGIKTAVKNLVQELEMSEQDVCDVCASFQECISEILLDRVKNAVIMAESLNIKINDFVVTGGVAANNFLRKKLKKHINLNILFPPINLCTDNAVMVGWTGIEILQKDYIDSLNFAPRPRWELGSY
ncbi:tRNA (adenosine(37)-N6)-threonylcarbamoyltransferase complex transferase subunit TsaD [Wolbachia endosymbiont of Brugia malayi]|uniref:tRNA N6-adenosine threonylcarbamoyltransferase n=1 Tax=Wolbachia sp. subsp. Brugia malayi (strain TRS) TaxID=292805 RepID=TSAD_WOLTR|nr:tRNA (adenosine(37)-N6)-threonylcarbamoyltransferase complex transferase subunit TsaD [Wolbachia endosymbiont of Brugia malayi]Q5GT66.1 RecName: Full=tRNA N6-adenosine threonylcarbamoyltransferase; AltName: Full=N6-L-threonylcarbamoyladenine synthase; Short=t(6)A synthase; AltName: Full=t(6)A37 threonylcarbamoyladenosine biosynthesis protein TsaD; AltName: Full=tRNA threonylcarbamoyladenosine biosynthesis protein TsaD [Wolbachia endosymbiont strain TRS of Brugia malayi]AAW70808.1 Metal-depende